MFVCFETIKTGFLDGCRPFVGLDGCHLKGSYGGCFLAVVSLDEDRGVFPLAFGIVEVKCGDSWKFFLVHLLQCIGSGTETVLFTFISNRHKASIYISI